MINGMVNPVDQKLQIGRTHSDRDDQSLALGARDVAEWSHSSPVRPAWGAAAGHHGSLAKRLFDIAFSGLGLLLSLPVWVMIALTIKLADGGPVFYGQERVGRYGRRFKSWKFRSMIVDVDRRFDGLQARERDPRITRVGRVLRATALDELPQLWNIFRGDMSFVGPRALLGAEIEVNGTGELVPVESIAGFHARHQVLPGLTGVAQIYADRDIPRRHKFRYDLIYIRRRNFWLDLRLIALSFWITFHGTWELRGAKLQRWSRARVARTRRSAQNVATPSLSDRLSRVAEATRNASPVDIAVRSSSQKIFD